MGFSILESILSVFFTALIVTVIFRQLRLSVILGYLLVGALMGPHALGLIPEVKDINDLAEFGIVFLMFTVGLEFSLPKLFALKSSVFFIGGLQVLFCIVITTLIGVFLHMSILSALVVGGIVAMSSTAIVVKQLSDQVELYSPHGLNAVGVLLFQDLAVVPFIILIPELSASPEKSLTLIFFWALVKGIIAILLIFMFGRLLLRPIFKLIAKTRAIELFTLTVLLVTLASAWLTHTLGLSFALGAFLAGMMLAETEFRHQIEVEIRPFRDILLGLFFITIGMLTNMTTWPATWIWIALLLIALIIGKFLLILLLSYLSGNDYTTSFRTGLVLAQGGEFGFAILTLALNDKIIPDDYGQVILAALLISIAIAPLLIYFNKRIVKFIWPKTSKINEEVVEKRISAITQKLKHHVVICGYGRVGQHIARLLDSIRFPYIGLDIDSELIQDASLAGDSVIYGDATHPGILKAAGLEHAKVLVISTSDYRSAQNIFTMAYQMRPDLQILVRCRDETELKKFKELGAKNIIAEIYEASLSLSSLLLNIIDIPAKRVADLIHNIRKSDYDLLQKVFSGSFEDDFDYPPDFQKQLHPAILPKDSFAIGHPIKDFNLQDIKVEVIALRRGSEKLYNPSVETPLETNDILVLFGEPSDLEEAERRLLQGI